MTLTKQPYEKLDYDFEFANAIDPGGATGDTIQSAEVTASPSGPTLSGQAISGTRVKIWVEGGTDGVTYKLTCRAVSTQGRKSELDLNIAVIEV